MWPQVQADLPAEFRHSIDDWNRSRPALLMGSAAVFSLALIWQTHLSIRGMHVHAIDCALRFNAFTLAEEALRIGRTPEEILQSITIQRAFTPYQILDVLRSIGHRARPGAHTIFFLLSPCKQFFDRDVGRQEGAYLLQKMFRYIDAIQQRDIPLLVVEKETYANTNWLRARQDLYRLAHPVWELSSLEQNWNVTYTLHTMNQGRIQNGQNTGTLFHAGRSRSSALSEVSQRITTRGPAALRSSVAGRPTPDAGRRYGGATQSLRHHGVVHAAGSTASAG